MALTEPLMNPFINENALYTRPEARLPDFQPDDADLAFLHLLLQSVRGANSDLAALDRAFAHSRLPQEFRRIILVLYAHGQKRILVSRSAKPGEAKFSPVLNRLLTHPRTPQLAVRPFNLQIDFVIEPPLPVDFYAVGMELTGERHFEVGVDGLIMTGPDEKTHLFPPGDAYVRSVMSMPQLREYLTMAHGEEYLRQSKFRRFRSESFLATQQTWRCLYRGYPVIGPLTRGKVEHAVALAVDHIQRTQEADGRFLYYYDAALDSRRDHEHMGRDPDKNPFYNILRHGGGGLTCIYHEKYSKCGNTLDNIRRAIDFLVEHARVQDYDGREGAYIYSEKKSKLGGSGIALYLISEYQLLTGDKRYQAWADKIAWHLINQITASGEFIYYNIYLDQPVTEETNHNYFSFYYPGEAVCGLAKYLHLADAGMRKEVTNRLHRAMDFLLNIRPTTRADQYTKVPSDSWLMMGVMELWDFEEMRNPAYADFVFSDAEKMMAQMYKVTDAPYPDYAGGFYYDYGDYPYADGARCEGLLGAYELAVKMNDIPRMQKIRRALELAAWAVMHLVNTEDAIYAVRNPDMALGGIRFKYTRQWFRIDTIQHVTCFFAKLLPHWERHAG